MSSLGPVLGAVARGVRARWLLSLGTLLLTALAVASAVLGPMFQLAATNSYVVTRLGEEANPLTGLTFELQPRGRAAADPEVATAAAIDAVRPRVARSFAPPTAALVTDRFPALDGRATLLARAGACAHLVIEGRCPSRAGEVLLLGADLEQTGGRLGDSVPLLPGLRGVVVGRYTVPTGEEDFWFDLQRLVSVPERRGLLSYTPYQPAPLITAPDTFARVPPGLWKVRVDARFDAAPDLTPSDLDAALAVARGMESHAFRTDAGRLRGLSGNELAAIAAEVRDQQETARLTIAPAVISLVLVALALLLRLLLAAAELRRPELALASLRGTSQRRLWALGLSEPVAILAVAVPLGVGLGVALTTTLVRAWLVPGLPLPFSPLSAAAAALVVAASVAVAAVAVGQVLRDPLSSQLSGVRRPAGTGRARLVAELATIALALVVLAAELGAPGDGRPDATDLVLPVLLAVAAGLVTTRLVSSAARRWTRVRGSRGSLAGFLAVRAVSRRHEGTLVVLPVTAAIAVGVFAAGVDDSAAAWRASAAATRAPADVVWTSPLSMTETVTLTHALDPDGSWVMAAATLLDPAANVAVLDTPRLDRVASWPGQWTPGHPAGEVESLVAPASATPVVTGDRLTLTVTSDLRSDDPVYVELALLSADGDEHRAFLGPVEPGEGSLGARTPYCADGCRLTGLAVGGPAAQPARFVGSLRVAALIGAGDDEPAALADAGWRAADDLGGSDRSPLTTVDTDGAVLEVTADTGRDLGVVRLATGDVPASRPVVVGLGADESVEPVDGGSRLPLSSTGPVPVDPVLRAESVPFLGPSGVLIDYTMMTRENALTDSLTRVYVLARGDTPDAVTRALVERGLHVVSTRDGVESTLDQEAYALALSLYGVVAVLVLVMAFSGLAVSTAVQLPSRRRDAASLRVVGVRRRAIMASVAREFAVVLGAATVAGVAAGTLAQQVVLRTLTLGYVDDTATPRVVAEVDWQRLAVLALVAAVLLGVAALVSAGLTVRGARGATLRESTR